LNAIGHSMDIFDSYARHVSLPYTRFLQRIGMDFEPGTARGAELEDRKGRTFIDCIGGYGNLNVGHNHPRVIEAIARALERQRPVGWPFISEAHAALAEGLVEVAPDGIDRCLIVNSGSEAVDSALKLVRLATGRSGVICCNGAWHGFTMGAMSVSEPEMCRGFEPLLPGVRRVPFGEAVAVEKAMSAEIGAVIVEPIQSESGGVVSPKGYLKRLATVCAEYGAILILDEIKSGMGKTGRMFACEIEQLEPDLLLVGKSLGGGVMPIGAVLAKRKWWAKFGLSFAMTSSSAAGNRLACAAGLATLDIIRSESLIENAENQGRRLMQGLMSLAQLRPELVRSVSGQGLLVGIHTAEQRVAYQITAECVRRGVLVMPAFLDRSCILIEPPLCIDKAQVDEVLRVLHQACDADCLRGLCRRVEPMIEP